MSANTTDPLIGRLLDGRYQVRSRIARGGMATVYLATDLRLERRVAIKVMHGHLADDSKFKDRFIQEARSAARLAHPNVVNVFDQGQDVDMAYLVMEYLPGITLRELLSEHRVLTTEQTLDIMEAVLGGLAAAHKAGIVHRDLKPENVLLADDGRIKISDFGLARAATANTATGAALMGTIAYLSPELVTRGIADTRSDIYAVGIMMYEMLVGEQPFKGEQPMQIAYQHANDTVPAPSSRNPRVPAELDELVLWATARDPEDRPRDARVMLDQLFETHNSLMTALPSTATGAQRTLVLPAAPPVLPAAADRAAETQVLGPRSPATAPSVSANTASLAALSQRRRGRAWWIVALIALLVAAGLGLGWYFGVGPGSKTTIPASIVGMTEADARFTLEALGFTVAEATGQAHHPSIEPGLVAGTDPAAEESVPTGSEVTLLLSIGPQPLTVPPFAGMSEADARAAIGAAPFTLAEPIVRQFDPEVPAGTVLDAYAADGSSLTGVAEYGELQPVSLLISAGPLPDVVGLTVEAAQGALRQAGLEPGAVREDAYHDTIPQGDVVALQPLATPVRVGDLIDLVTSKGVELVEVPDVIGWTWAEAKDVLVAAGFDLVYNGTADLLPGVFVVADLNPDELTMQPKGSQLRIGFSS